MSSLTGVFLLSIYWHIAMDIIFFLINCKKYLINYTPSLHRWHFYHLILQSMDSSNRTMTSQSNGHPLTPGGATNPLALPGVDAEKLKNRLYSYAPGQMPVNPNALKFSRRTPAQLKKVNAPNAGRLEPLVSISGGTCTQKLELSVAGASDPITNDDILIGTDAPEACVA